MGTGQKRGSITAAPTLTLCPFLCLLGGGSLSGLVRALTVSKCVSSSIICGGWFCSEQELFCSLMAALYKIR